jgi:hypothetical protein
MPLLFRQTLELATDLGHDHVRFIPVCVTKIRDKSTQWRGMRAGEGGLRGYLPVSAAASGGRVPPPD